MRPAIVLLISAMLVVLIISVAVASDDSPRHFTENGEFPGVTQALHEGTCMWVDGGNYLYPNSSYADNLNVSGEVRAGSLYSPKTVIGDVSLDTLSVQGKDIDFSFLLHEDSKDPGTAAFVTYSRAQAMHLYLMKAAGTAGSPEEVLPNATISQVVGLGYDGTTFRKLGSLNFATDGEDMSDAGPSGRVTLKTAVFGHSALGYEEVFVLDSKRRAIFKGPMVMYYMTHSEITSDQDNYDLGVLRRGLNRLSTDATRTITGFRKPYNMTGYIEQFEGEVIMIVNVGTKDLVIANQNTGSDPENRVITGTGSSLTLNRDESLTMFYDNISKRWRVISTTGS